eukprot:12133274-Ditylum_brightwellii.AAC.1
MNNQSSSVKACYPHTQNWISVPFKADRFITDHHITLMIRKQNIYLRDETAILVTNLQQIDLIITVPGTNTQLSFHCWLLMLKTADDLKTLFSTAKKDPNEVYYFVTKKKLQDKAEEWIDQLPDLLFSQFSLKDTSTVTTNLNPTCSYKSLPTEHTDDAVSYYKSVLSDQLPETEAYNEPETINVVEKDFLENY